MKNSSNTTEYLDQLSSGHPGGRTSFRAAGVPESFRRMRLWMLKQTKRHKCSQKFKLRAKHKPGE